MPDRPLPLALQQLQAWYQPKFNLQTGEVCGVEVPETLLRAPPPAQLHGMSVVPGRLDADPDAGPVRKGRRRHDGP